AKRFVAANRFAIIVRRGRLASAGRGRTAEFAIAALSAPGAVTGSATESWESQLVPPCAQEVRRCRYALLLQTTCAERACGQQRSDPAPQTRRDRDWPLSVPSISPAGA